MESGSSFHNIARQMREFQREKKLLHRTDVAFVSSPPLLMLSFANAHLCHEMMTGKQRFCEA